MHVIEWQEGDVDHAVAEHANGEFSAGLADLLAAIDLAQVEDVDHPSHLTMGLADRELGVTNTRHAEGFRRAAAHAEIAGRDRPRHAMRIKHSVFAMEVAAAVAANLGMRAELLQPRP